MMNARPSVMSDPIDHPRGGFLSRLGARFENPGLTRGQERALNVALGLVIVLFTGGWGMVVADAVSEARPLGVARELSTSPLSTSAPPPITVLLDRLMEDTRDGEWRGRSGAVRAIITDPGARVALADTLGLDSLPEGARLEVREVGRPGTEPGAADPPTDRPGAFNLLLRVRNEARALADMVLLSPVSADLIENGRLGEYLVGDWPTRSERPAKLRTEKYDAPAGLIAVTPENRGLAISDHLELEDFLTKGQTDTWPKYVAITPALLDKVELTLQELERSGHPVEEVGVISGFRTPYYNSHGGNTSGRGSVSRHMYGDALDFYVDNDGDGRMDDLNGDGRVDKGDARVIAEAANRVEQKYPEYVGGVGVYGPTGAHSGFVHIDARGYRARW
jgi:uncharacterized protein YcbK (DUF882 family)